MEYSIMSDIENVETLQCIICFEDSSPENKVESIKNFYIQPDCSCRYNVHSKCINEWQMIQLQQRDQQQHIYQTRKLSCLYCNSPIMVRAKWNGESYKKNTIQIICIIVGSILGIALLMIFIALIVNSKR